MNKSIDYFAVSISPWTYLGHERFRAIARQANATVHLKMMDLGTVFAGSGGLPLKQRAPQRQTYRLQELARWAQHLNIALTPQPAFFPADTSKINALIVYLRDQVSTDTALDLMGTAMASIWGQNLNIADDAVLLNLLS